MNRSVATRKRNISSMVGNAGDEHIDTECGGKRQRIGEQPVSSARLQSNSVAASNGGIASQTAKEAALAEPIFLAYPDLANSKPSQVPFQQPSQLITFSYTPEHVQEFTDSALRYFVDPPLGASLSYGYERWNRKPDTRGRIDALLKAVSRVRKDPARPLPEIGVVSWRGVMTKILTAPYENREGWDLNVMYHNGTLYFEEHASEERLNEKNNMNARQRSQTYYGYAFESYCTSEAPAGKYTGQTDTFVELKTSLTIRGQQDEAKFERKLLKFYFQSFLLGVPEIVVGFRTPAGVVTTVQSFKTIQLPRLVRGKPGAWDPLVCLDWGRRVLMFLKDTARARPQDENRHSIPVWRVRFVPGSGLNIEELDRAGVEDVENGEDRVGFLPRWHWEEINANAPATHAEQAEATTTRVPNLANTHNALVPTPPVLAVPHSDQLIVYPFEASRKGHVALSCRLLALDDQSVTLEFCVTDTGIGIAKDKLNLIFDTFCQADGSTTREYGGTGLGLSISKRLVSLMQGNMWVESEVSKGSKFFFTITSQISHSTMEATLAKMAPFQKRTILFVDTLFDNTGVVHRIKELGLRPHVVHEVSEVSDKEKCPHIDTIVVDSLQVTESIREFEHLRYIPVVLLAPSMPRLNLKWCLDNSISSQVTTPVTAQDLSSALVSALESNTVSPVSAPNDVTFDILLAEDNLVNQKLAVKILEKYGHTVEIAENGSLAVDAFKGRVAQGKPFDIILMDVSMPFMGGMEATELIRSYEMHKSLTPTPIIALTAHAMIGDRERCLEAGMDDHITKPLRRGDLLNAINKLAGERGGGSQKLLHLLRRPPHPMNFAPLLLTRRMKNIFASSLLHLSAIPALIWATTVPNADTPLFYLVSSSQSPVNLLPVRMPSGGGGGVATLGASGVPAQFYFCQGALTVYDPNNNVFPYRPLVNSVQDASGCQSFGALVFVQGTSTNKCARCSSFQIQSNAENSQLGAELVFNYVGGFFACGSGEEIWYKINPSDGPSGCDLIISTLSLRLDNPDVVHLNWLERCPGTQWATISQSILTSRQFYFQQGRLRAYDPDGSTVLQYYMPLLSSQLISIGCSTYGGIKFIPGPSTNKGALYEYFQIQSNTENSQLGAKLVFNHVGRFYHVERDRICGTRLMPPMAQ
ncbi:hypothetical protein NLJ89_g859 [Agrocybe chaxingu]|uniref:Uncharacterized protein n=1 Tax=Agrocybe chaxingu TaxID=84603 RepID=A0A9W8N190_9AGAR|nr:hypothetical protein NLJ89_g859 [Agrocybe chaxingu]